MSTSNSLRWRSSPRRLSQRLSTGQLPVLGQGRPRRTRRRGASGRSGPELAGSTADRILRQLPRRRRQDGIRSKLPILGAWRINFDPVRPGAEARESLQGHRHGDLYGGERRHQAGGVSCWPPTKADYKERLHRRCARVLLQARRQEHLSKPAGTERAGPDRGHVAGRSQHAVSRTRDQGRRRTSA